MSEATFDPGGTVAGGLIGRCDIVEVGAGGSALRKVLDFPVLGVSTDEKKLLLYQGRPFQKLVLLDYPGLTTIREWDTRDAGSDGPPCRGVFSRDDRYVCVFLYRHGYDEIVALDTQAKDAIPVGNVSREGQETHWSTDSRYFYVSHSVRDLTSSGEPERRTSSAYKRRYDFERRVLQRLNEKTGDWEDVDGTK
jgi:hypothetical protein